MNAASGDEGRSARTKSKKHDGKTETCPPVRNDSLDTHARHKKKPSTCSWRAGRTCNCFVCVCVEQPRTRAVQKKQHSTEQMQQINGEAKRMEKESDRVGATAQPLIASVAVLQPYKIEATATQPTCTTHYTTSATRHHYTPRAVVCTEHASRKHKNTNISTQYTDINILKRDRCSNAVKRFTHTVFVQNNSVCAAKAVRHFKSGVRYESARWGMCDNNQRSFTRA